MFTSKIQFIHFIVHVQKVLVAVRWKMNVQKVWNLKQHLSWTMCNAIKHDIGINYILCAASIKSVGSSHLQQFNSPQISSRRTNLKSSISQSPRKSVRVFLEELPKPGCVILLFCSQFSCFTPCTSIPHLKVFSLTYVIMTMTINCIYCIPDARGNDNGRRDTIVFL